MLDAQQLTYWSTVAGVMATLAIALVIALPDYVSATAREIRRARTGRRLAGAFALAFVAVAVAEVLGLALYLSVALSVLAGTAPAPNRASLAGVSGWVGVIVVLLMLMVLSGQVDRRKRRR